MNLQEYLNLSKEEFEFILENAELRELEDLYNCLDIVYYGKPNGDEQAVITMTKNRIAGKYLFIFNRRKQNMQNKA